MKFPRLFRRSDDTGQTMAEFSLVLPVLVLILFAILQFGIVLNKYLTLTDAVRAGARQGAVARFLPPSERVPKIEDAVEEAATDLDSADDGFLVEVVPPAEWKTGESVTVRASVEYDINLLGLVVKSGTLVSETTERVE